MRVAFVVAMLAAVLLAGCSGGKPKASADDLGQSLEELGLEATKDTGVLRGIVVDEAIQPMAGVGINMTGPDGYNGFVVSNENGAFGVDGLVPGTYFLVAFRETYQPIQTTAEVVAGVDDPDPVKILLLADAASRPYPQQYVLEGFITCSARVVLTALPAGQCVSTDRSQVAYSLDRIPDWGQSEMTWKSTQALGDAMSLVSECFTGIASDPDPCPDGNLVVNRSEGSSPLIIKMNGTLLQQFRYGDGNPYRLRVFAAGRGDTDVINEDQNNAMLNSTTGGAVQCVAWPAVNQGCFRFTGAGVILNQAFKVFTTVFYGYGPPEEWLFIEAGDVPQPD